MEDAAETAFVAAQYGPLARAYVQSAVHSGGPDLDQMEALLREARPARVLDLGCGGGHVSYRAAPWSGRVTACDVTQEMLDAVAAAASERGLSNISVRRAAAEALPFEDASFDAVLCRFTTHHWDDMGAGLRSARRVLAAGGLAVFTDSVAAPDAALDTHLQAVELLRDPSHVRNYSVREWAAALATAGFDVSGATVRTLRMEFSSWIERTRTPALQAGAIRALQDGAPPRVKTYFKIGPDGGFDLEVATFVARAAG